MQSFTSCLMHVVPFQMCFNLTRIKCFFCKIQFLSCFLTKAVSGWPRCVFPSACLLQVESSSWRRSAGFKIRVSKTFVCIKTIWQTFYLKRCGICTVLSNGWEFTGGGFEHEGCPSSSPLKTGMLDPTPSAKCWSVFHCSIFHTEQVRAPEENTDHGHERRNG